MCETGKREKMIKTCIEGANGFYEVAKRLDPLSQMDAYFMNYSFCCELYLKALLMKTRADGKYKRTHNLLVLFKKLPKQEKDGILEQFRQTSSTDLMDFLSDEQNAFDNWRYAFEVKELHGDVSGFEEFARALNTYINTRI